MKKQQKKNETHTANPENIVLSPEETQRYSRHLILPEIGPPGQKKIKAGKVLLIGAGGLGSPLALYLAAAGVGEIGILDYDLVDASNLQRQVIHGEKDIGFSKVKSARESMLAINPHIQVNSHEEPLSASNALEIFEPYDIIVDGTDNFPTRYLSNDACVLLDKPLVYGSIFRFEGQVSVFDARRGPCYRCLFPEPPPPGAVPSCAEGGVLGVLPGTIGMLQATEVLKLILETGESLIGRLLVYDALAMEFNTMRLRKDSKCAVCGENPTLTELIDYEQFCGVPAHDRDSFAQDEGAILQISPTELKRRLEANEHFFMLDVRETHEWEVSNLGHLGAKLIPQGKIPERLVELDPAVQMVVFCRSGKRSADVIRLLQKQGFQKLLNLAGGINAWANEVDSDLLRY